MRIGEAVLDIPIASGVDFILPDNLIFFSFVRFYMRTDFMDRFPAWRHPPSRMAAVALTTGGVSPPAK